MGEYKNVPQEINDVVSDNIKKLAQLFPSAVKDGQLDVNALKEELGTFEEVGKEKYEFTWSGKQNAKKIAQQDVFGKTLKFCPEKSKNADTTENIYIEGDNLEALKLLRQNYYNSIKMIYIDPPYNTGNDFVYNDDYSMSQEESDIAEGVVDELGERYTKNQKSTNRFHAKWLNEMYPRLKLAKDLLTDDGVIFISMDDNEIDNLKKLCNEIFGDDNVEMLVWNKEAEGSSGTLKQVTTTRRIHEYIVCAFKNIGTTQFFKIHEALKGKENEFQTANLAVNADKEKTEHPNYFTIMNPSGECFTRQWKWSKPEIDRLISENLIYWGSDGHKQPRLIIPTDERRTTFLLSILNYGGTTVGRKDFENLLGTEIEFSYPKPVILLKKLIGTACSHNDQILDFFSGSATTAHAVMQLNAEDGGNRKFIMVQLEEKTDEKSEAHKAGYKTICEIGEERIRRAGDKIAEECQAKIDEYKSKLEVLANNPNGKGIPVEEDEPYPIPDIGFKVFEIANTNIKWNELELKDEQIDFANLSNNPDQVDFKQGTKDIDVVYEIMLRQKNIPLSSKIEVLDEIGSRTYLYADSYLVCLETQVTNEMIDKLASLDPTPFKYIFRDSAFKDDIDLKTNAFRRLKAMVEKHAGATKKAYTVEFI